MFQKQNIIIVLIISIYSYCLATSFKGPTPMDNYGSYDLNVSVEEKCAGPKLKTVANYNITMSRNGSDVFAKIFFNFLEPTKIEEIRMIVYSFKDGKKHILWNYRLNKPCQHFMFGDKIKYYLRAKNCVVQPGLYLCDVNYTELFREFFGTSFFYGDFFLKSNMLTSKANIMCLISSTQFTKKKT